MRKIEIVASESSVIGAAISVRDSALDKYGLLNHSAYLNPQKQE